MDKTRSRIVLATLALVLLALPAFAAPMPSSVAAGGCQPGPELLAPPAAISSPAVTPSSSWLDGLPGVPSVTYHGYCRCSCSRVHNCNTSADCGGSPCLGGISCC